MLEPQTGLQVPHRPAFFSCWLFWKTTLPSGADAAAGADAGRAALFWTAVSLSFLIVTTCNRCHEQSIAMTDFGILPVLEAGTMGLKFQWPLKIGALDEANWNQGN
jgi:hypothetical protein